MDMDWKKLYQEKKHSVEDAVKVIKSGDRIYIGTASSVAYKLCDALYERKDELENVTVCHGLLTRVLPFFKEESKGHFSSISYFAGPGERLGISTGQTQWTSLSLSQIRLWCKEIARPNVAFLEVSLPDENGYMSLGAYGPSFHEYVASIADVVVLQVNKNVPYVYGENTLIHISDATIVAEADDDLSALPNTPFDDTIKTLASHIIPLIPDGACLQLGIGGIANAVGYGLKNHTDLGVHTEMLTDSMMDLMKAGVITNKKKNFMPGKAMTAFAFGSKDLYEFVNHNEDIYFAPFNIVNDPFVIAKNDNMISVNTAMSVDLYGQVVADCLGGKQQSAIGGQVDYVRGSQLSKGGKSIIALTSTLDKKDGSKSSRIVASFPAGTAVTTSRSDVQYVATEYGCVNLNVLTMPERAKAMISLAHPSFRDELLAQAKQFGIL